MRFDAAQTAAARSHLTGADGTALIDYLYRLNTGGDVQDVPAPVREVAITLGWTDAAGGLTETGGFVSDSCREYVFWLDRERALPFEGTGGLTRDWFADKAVVEIGAGMGVNLMSLGRTVRDLSGVEPLEIYTQMGEILRDREGLPPVEVKQGSGEVTPFPDARFDVVLCVSAHQYMDICAALHELVRILKPGGELIIIGGTLDRYLRDALAEFPVQLKAHAITTVNTLGYMGLRRRPLPPRGGPATTSRPIYPLPGAMVRWMKEAGLDPDRQRVRIDTETVFRGIKRR